MRRDRAAVQSTAAGANIAAPATCLRSIEVGDLLVSVEPVTVSVEDLLTSDLDCCDSWTVEESTHLGAKDLGL